MSSSAVDGQPIYPLRTSDDTAEVKEPDERHLSKQDQERETTIELSAMAKMAKCSRLDEFLLVLLVVVVVGVDTAVNAEMQQRSQRP